LWDTVRAVSSTAPGGGLCVVSALLLLLLVVDLVAQAYTPKGSIDCGKIIQVILLLVTLLLIFMVMRQK
jgi:hypothetical protein